MEVMVYAVVTSALDTYKWSFSRLGRFTPKETASGTNWIGGWVDPSGAVGALEKKKSLFVQP
jgi:hypothetical protein